MEFYKLNTAYNKSGNSPWDALWYDGDVEELHSLYCQMPLTAIWKAPKVRLEKRNSTPDFYVFIFFYATTKSVCSLLEPLIKDTVEFLPLNVANGKRLFAIHPLLRIDLDDRAIVSPNIPGENITVVDKYSFDDKQITDDLHIFHIRQAQGSAARDAGYAMTGLFVSGKFKKLFEENKLKGIVFNKIWPETT